MQKNTTLTNLARYDKGIIQNETSLTEEGFIKGRCIVTRCGVFLYKNADGTIRKELRHPDDVIIPESMESMKMIPVVDGHPPERLVTAANAKRLQIGFTGETIEAEMPYIIANLVITDKNVVEKIKDKKKNELSLGYTVDLLPSPGVYNGEPYDFRQTNIRYNHLALVDEARAGPEAKIVLDGNDAILINEEVTKMSKKKVKIDAEEYLLEDNAAEGVEGLKKKYEDLVKAHEDMTKEHMALKDAHEKVMAERDSLRDKDHHDPKMVHEPLSGEKSEEDEIGPKGKEEKDPIDAYGMQSHVRDYEKPSHMREHVVSEPKNQHYPHDLPKIPNVDGAEVQRRVKERVRLEKLAERYLDKTTVSRMDSISDLEIKKRLILSIQKNANLDGKSDTYINARFDSVVEELPGQKVIALPSRMDANQHKENADARGARFAMIERQKNAYKARSN
jgi:uncharacterized protein